MKALRCFLLLGFCSLSFSCFSQQFVERGWFISGTSPDSYTAKPDNSTSHHGQKCVLLESVKNTDDGFATVMQYCSANDFLGKKIKMTGYIKPENVTDWSGMWLRIDDRERNSLAFDNMQDRPVTGTSDWVKCEIVVDVPKESIAINYGALISKTGKIWFDDVSFEILESQADSIKVQDTGMIPPKPENLDFEE